MSKQIYIVEFGKTDRLGWVSFGVGGQEPLYVIANSYDDAANKAKQYIDTIPAEKQPGIIDSDGSLNLPEDNCLRIKGVKLLTDNIIE